MNNDSSKAMEPSNSALGQRLASQKAWIDSILGQYFKAAEELESLPLRDRRLGEMLRADFYDREIAADVEVGVIRLARSIRQLCRSSLGGLRMKVSEMASKIEDDIGGEEFGCRLTEMGEFRGKGLGRDGSFMMLEDAKKIGNSGNTVDKPLSEENSIPKKQVKTSSKKSSDKLTTQDKLSNETLTKKQKHPDEPVSVTKSQAQPLAENKEHSQKRDSQKSPLKQKFTVSVKENLNKEEPKIAKDPSRSQENKDPEPEAEIRNPQPSHKKIILSGNAEPPSQPHLPISELMQQTTGHDRSKACDNAQTSDRLPNQVTGQTCRSHRPVKRHDSSAMTVVTMNDILGKRKPEIFKLDRKNTIPACLKEKISRKSKYFNLEKEVNLESEGNRGLSNLEAPGGEKHMDEELTIQLEEFEVPLKIKLPPSDEEVEAILPFNDQEKERKKEVSSSGLDKLQRNSDLFPTSSPESNREKPYDDKKRFGAILEPSNQRRSTSKYKAAELFEAKNHYLPSLGIIQLTKARSTQ